MENLRQAYISLTTNKLRSILTMLGIIMGVFSVVAIMAISNATKVYLSGELNKMGANTVTIQYNTSKDLNPSDYLEVGDMDRILQGVDEIEYIIASKTYYTSLKMEKETRDAIIVGVTSQFIRFKDVSLVEGRFISNMDVKGSRPAIIVSDKFAEEYFGEVDALGKEVQVVNYYGDRLKTKIIGIISTEDDLFASLMEGVDFPVSVIMPLTTVQDFFGTDKVDNIQISAKESADLKAVGKKIIRLLEFTHHNEKMYIATTIKEIQQSVRGILNVISSILLLIAVITLIVGGIGIVNILLVSVTERIREIGIRKAIGAKKRDIVLQFLTESIMMTGIGGLIGIILGLLMGAIISKVISIPPVVDVVTITLAFFGSILLGIVFGVYPAKKAADLDPIESLRYE